MRGILPWPSERRELGGLRAQPPACGAQRKARVPDGVRAASERQRCVLASCGGSCCRGRVSFSELRAATGPPSRAHAHRCALRRVSQSVTLRGAASFRCSSLPFCDWQRLILSPLSVSCCARATRCLACAALIVLPPPALSSEHLSSRDHLLPCVAHSCQGRRRRARCRPPQARKLRHSRPARSCSTVSAQVQSIALVLVHRDRKTSDGLRETESTVR